MAELINDLHYYTGQNKCDLMLECLEALSKDYKEWKFEQRKS